MNFKYTCNDDNITLTADESKPNLPTNISYDSFPPSVKHTLDTINKIKFSKEGKDIFSCPKNHMELATYKLIVLIAIPTIGVIGAIKENIRLILIYQIITFIFASSLIESSPRDCLVFFSLFAFIFLICLIRKKYYSSDKEDNDDQKYEVVDHTEVA